MNILLTSTGRRTYLVEYFKQALNGNGKVYASNSNYTYSLSQADDYVLTPLIYSDDYIPFLLEFCIENKIDIIISLFDIDLPILSKNIDVFKAHGIQVVISSSEVIDICNDKWLTYQFLIKNKLTTPKTFVDKNIALEAINDGGLAFPIILKPRWGMGSIGIYKADNIEELDVFYNKIKSEILNSYLKYESEGTIDYSILIQQCIKGKEYGIEVINDLDTNYVNTLCKVKLAMRSGETDQAMTVNDQSLITIGQNLSEKLKHIANLDVDCLEENGDFYVLEMNARFGGQYPFSHLAGANLPLQIIEWCRGKKTNLDNVTIDYDVLCSKDIKPVIINNGN
ncbi:ATP-grasp domain-containing protein [Aliivibrio fischeri]|uniref:ATP-grasp domain-containing protein n=1 Tax=Aliivibrio fischeri TaxID=668 RepID=UPI0012DA9EE4|nr:ATP-grasp domain-containing protein [Aliivibrio fischeri]MUK67955.1 ATP-grasp domain-containing protein [Aliivibrio fischeri]MUK72902.1 ATP-grasp domain-containing protein [Aliivibrio fischeri]